MGKLSAISGEKLMRILCNRFGFAALRQKGSHVTLNRGSICVTIPLKEIRAGLLNRILKDCGIDKGEFEKIM
ncbi:TPA: type II toxin-antitoxin system HicA family toxin [Candidatus Micrarchaeota archaeon]|nr:type II toxin-antitoxin system HicA family toxin [Candidatus Micrarchaeota archaeon]